jgi:hypothetical protein
MRAAAAYSSLDMLRHSLRTDQALDAQDPADLPDWSSGKSPRHKP